MAQTTGPLAGPRVPAAPLAVIRDRLPGRRAHRGRGPGRARAGSGPATGAGRRGCAAGRVSPNEDPSRLGHRTGEHDLQPELRAAVGGPGTRPGPGAKGALLKGYYGIGHDSLDNYIAEISGQAPNYQTNQDCEYFSKFLQFGGENFDKWTKDGQLSGDGCVYPEYVRNIASQLTAHGRSWKSYNQQMGNDPARDGTTATAHGPACGHPKLGTVDQTDVTGPAHDSYATRHNPFVYFENIIGSPAYCDSHVVTLQPLSHDLAHASTTPAYSWITPDTCADGHDTPTCQDGAKGGLGQVDRFLATWVPRIMGSPAYRQGGLVFITFDESGDDTDATACCGEKDSLGFTDPSHPNVNEPGLYGPGGGRVGAVALSPFIKPGTRTGVDYNHYSLLKTVEKIFGLPLLGDARQPQVRAFGPDVFTR